MIDTIIARATIATIIFMDPPISGNGVGDTVGDTVGGGVGDTVGDTVGEGVRDSVGVGGSGVGVQPVIAKRENPSVSAEK